MPFVQISIAEGRSPEQIRALIHEVSDAVVRSIGAPLANVRVVVTEVPLTHWAAGDVTLQERKSHGS